MKIVFRVDASRHIAAGHVVRCLALAVRVREKGADVAFLSRPLDGNLIPMARNTGFPVHELNLPGSSQDVSVADDATETSRCVREHVGHADWLIVDHYAFDDGWETAQRTVASRIMAIDDFGERRHDCDLLLDQNLFPNADVAYRPLAPAGCIMLTGPRYALLRDEFLLAREQLRRNAGPICRLLVFFGGVDATGETLKTLAAIAQLGNTGFDVDVVIGAANPNRAMIERVASSMAGTTCHLQTTRMAELMSRADLAIGAGGSSTWERLCLGLPAIVISIAGHQARIAEELAHEGLTYFLGTQANVTADDIATAIETRIADVDGTRLTGMRGCDIVDGRGAQRVAEQLMRV